MPSLSVTIVGGTGLLGEKISSVFLTDYRSSFSRVRVLTRDTASEKSQNLASKGAELVKFDGSDVDKTLDEAFAGADVIVNALSSYADNATKHAVVQAAARSSAKVYFLGEFGIDHRINDFPGYEHPEWSTKQLLTKEARTSFKGKVIAVYTSLFLENLKNPAPLGFDVKNNAFAAYGPASQRVTFTALVDIGHAVARLAILASDRATAASVPDDLRIASDTVSFEDVRDIVARIKGVAPAEIKSEDLAAKKEALKTPGTSFLEYLRVVMGEGKADFGTTNEDELVNPGGKLWKWKTVEDQIRGL